MIYTIGHSNHAAEHFLALLTQHRITALADVRSTPFSRFNPQFNREKLKASLAGVGIEYVFLGAELGARSQDPACYDGDRVSYTKLAASPSFHQGIERLLTGMRQHRIAIMCAERSPLDCHRTILVSRALEKAGVSIGHILPDGTLEEHGHVMERLAVKLGLTARADNKDLFSTEGETTPAAIIEKAYEIQGAKMGYVNRRRSPSRRSPPEGG